MNTLTFLVPDSLHKQLIELAKREGVSVDQLASIALGEKIAALMSQDYFEQRMASASRSKFEDALSKVKDAEPELHNML